MKETADGNAPVAAPPGRRQWVVWVTAAAVFLAAWAHYTATLNRYEVRGVLFWVGTAALSSALASGLGGAVGWHLGVWHSSKVRSWDCFTWGMCLVCGIIGALCLLRPPSDVAAAATLAAAGFGAVTGTVGQFLLHGGSPTYYYGLALLRLRRGDRDGACEAIGSYLLLSHKDPDGPTRRPIAERFLQDESATLDVPVELEAAAPPEGRGTEPEAASSPAGRGTELQQALPDRGPNQDAPGGARVREVDVTSRTR